jgi:hypothetical protein
MSTKQLKEASTTIFNYPGFQSLPKGIKQMLVITEAQLFDQPISQQPEQSTAPRADGALEIFMTEWRNLLRSRHGAIPRHSPVFCS